MSVPMIREMRLRLSASSGHSERRELFGETNEDVNQKVRALLGGRLIRRSCAWASRSPCATRARPNEYVCAQVKRCVCRRGRRRRREVPSWPTSPSGPSARAVRPRLSRPKRCAPPSAHSSPCSSAQETAQAMRVLYGGSMNPGNVDALVAEPDIDGGLIGGASLKRRFLHPARQGGHAIMGALEPSAREGLALPVCLVIMDGFGLAPAGPGNAISLARTPFLDKLFAGECTRLQASGEAVGLPEGQMGNSEVGHLNIGAGRVVHQELTRINRACRDRFASTKTRCINACLDSSKEPGACAACHGASLRWRRPFEQRAPFRDPRACGLGAVLRTSACTASSTVATCRPRAVRATLPSSRRLDLPRRDGGGESASRRFAGAITRWIATSAGTACKRRGRPSFVPKPSVDCGGVRRGVRLVRRWRDGRVFGSVRARLLRGSRRRRALSSSTSGPTGRES